MSQMRGGIITRRPLCWTGDGRLFFAPCGKDVRVYSAVSAEHVGTLIGHTAAATAVALDPGSATQVYTSSLDGTLRLWDFVSGDCLRTYQIGQPIEHMVVAGAAGLAYLSLSHRLGAGKVLGFELAGGVPLSSSVRPRGALRGMAASPSGRFLAAPDKFSLWVWAAGEDGGRRPANFHHVRQYTCCAIDSTDTVLAAGDVSGRILIWHNFQAALTAAGSASNSAGTAGAGGGAPVATVHWHAHPVGCLAFSPDGAHLLSGGAEAVLVQWHLATGKRNYLPRLGGPLVGILPCASDPARYLIAQADNTVRVVNTATMRVEATVHGLRPAPPPPPGRPPGGCAALQPGTGYLVVSGPNALLQFFDAARERHAARLQVAPRNPVSLTRDAAAAALGLPPPVEPQVVAAAFGPGGAALVTVDVAPTTGAAAGPQQSLKFWDACGAAAAAAPGSAAAPFALNTRADAPHHGPITGLAYHPAADVVATTSEDGEFRIWARLPPRGQRDQQQQPTGAAPAAAAAGRWRCRSASGYKRRPLGACAFSGDGSLLAVGAGAAATLWDPDANALAAALPAPPGVAAGRRVVALAFSSRSPHLAGVLSARPGGGGDGEGWGGGGAGEEEGDVLVVWDLLALSVAWTCALPRCAALSADPERPLFAVAVNHEAPAGAAAAGGAGKAQRRRDGDGQEQPAGEEEGEQQQPQQPQPQPEQEREFQRQQQQQQQGQQQQRAQRRAQRRGCILLFSPDAPSPLLACALPPGSAAAALLHVPPRTQLGAAAPRAPGGAAPLLVVTEDRAYALLSRPAGSAAAAAALAEAPGMAEAVGAALAARESAVEAVFGKAAGAGAPAAAGAGDAAPDARTTASRVAALFDAPSHALPPPALLCSSLLEVLVARDGQGAS